MEVPDPRSKAWANAEALEGTFLYQSGKINAGGNGLLYINQSCDDIAAVRLIYMSGTTTPSPKSLSDFAKEGCDESFKAHIVKITDLLSDCLTTAGNPTEEQQCKSLYKAGVEFAKTVHEISLNVIGQVFTSPPGP